MKCFHHNDADGWFAAMWVFRLLKEVSENDKYISINYNDKFPLDSIEKNETVYIVDFSIPVEDMTELLKITKNVVWIDHHKTAIEKYADFHEDIKGIRCDGISGCELTWLYLKVYTDGGEAKDPCEVDFRESLELCPMHTRYIGDRDVWAYKFGEDTSYFHSGYQAIEIHDVKSLSEEMIDADYKISRIIENGKVIESFKKQQRKHVVDNYAYETWFGGFKCLVCNGTDKTSELFGDRFNDYDICAVYNFDGSSYINSLYSKKVDVGLIAKGLGGGGHKGAAGFVTKVNPFIKEVLE